MGEKMWERGEKCGFGREIDSFLEESELNFEFQSGMVGKQERD